VVVTETYLSWSSIPYILLKSSKNEFLGKRKCVYTRILTTAERRGMTIE
jgi:hypothetical protein